MRNYIAPGRCVTVKIKPSVREVHAGDALRIGFLFGIAATSVLLNDPRYPFGPSDEEREFELYVEGIYEIPSDASTFSTGDRVYFDPTTNQVTSTKPDPAKADASTFLVGVAVESIKRSDSMVRVRLNGISL